jgi:hypothetical protein
MKIQNIPGWDSLSMMEQLAVPFAPEQVKWRPGTITKDGSKGMALAYIDARDVMDRLNLVMGQEYWESEITVFGNIIVCKLSLWVELEDGSLVRRSKSDGAGETDIEGEKGGVSDALKRAAVQWGIGRYLYDLDAPWVAVEGKRLAETPQLPHWALPEHWIAVMVKRKAA